MFPEDASRSQIFSEMLAGQGFTKYEIGIAIFDLKEKEPKIFGYNMDHFIYPASVYKIFIGAEVLRRIEIGDFTLDQKIEIQSPNDVDIDSRIFPGDSRPLLFAGDSVSVDYLLDLMLTRSDNAASNTLIDLVGRESITQNIVYANKWHGSEVTRKFLNRIKEQKPYRFSETTMTCARHIAEFFYLVEKEKLVSPFVSRKLKEYMVRWNKDGRKGLAFKEYITMYRKGGYLESSLYSFRNALHLIKNIMSKGWATIVWSNDVAVIKTTKAHYVVAVFTVTKSINPYKRFPMERLGEQISNFMEV